jgi:hypothetical protein
MPSGERSKVWYPEMVAMLREGWRADLPWHGVVELRDSVQNKLDEIRQRRGILPPVIRCPSCGAVGPSKPPVVSVRAMLISVRRFGIDAVEAIETREREWERQRRRHGLDLLGKEADSRTPGPGDNGTCGVGGHAAD